MTSLTTLELSAGDVGADLQESSWIVFRTGDLASLFELVQKILQLAQVFWVMLCQIPANPWVLQQGLNIPTADGRIQLVHA
jgi:hypothetical protein